MKRSTMLAALTAMIVVLLAAFASAQVMHMVGDKSEKEAKALHSESDTLGVMKNMSKRCQKMSDNFGDLKEHFNTMMNMDNMAKLKMEMQKHHEMMSSMHNQMSEHQGMCQKMMSMMGSGGMQGHMMGEKSGKASKPDDHGHNH